MPAVRIAAALKHAKMIAVATKAVSGMLQQQKNTKKTCTEVERRLGSFISYVTFVSQGEGELNRGVRVQIHCKPLKISRNFHFWVLMGQIVDINV